MLDDEFIIVLKKAVPRLDRYFHRCLSNAKYRGDYKHIKRRLIGLTGYDAYFAGRDEPFTGDEIKALIMKKAANVFLNFIHAGDKSYGMEMKNGLTNKIHDPFYQAELREHLDRIKSKIDPETWEIIEMRADGMKYHEIGKTLDQTEASLKMIIHRLRKQLEEAGLQYL